MIWWGKLVSWFVGGGASGLATELRLARKDVLDAKNDRERLKAEERMYRVEARVAAQTSGAGTWSAKSVRAAFAAPYILYNGKLIIWDKMLGLGTTDPLSFYLEGVGWTIIGFYFLDNTLRQIRR